MLYIRHCQYKGIFFPRTYSIYWFIKLNSFYIFNHMYMGFYLYSCPRPWLRKCLKQGNNISNISLEKDHSIKDSKLGSWSLSVWIVFWPLAWPSYSTPLIYFHIISLEWVLSPATVGFLASNFPATGLSIFRAGIFDSSATEIDR